MMAAGGLVAALAAETALIAWRGLHQEQILPLPADFAAAVLIFGGLGLLAEANAKFAATIGWGLVVATFLRLWDPTNPTNVIPKKGQPAPFASAAAA